MIGNTFHNLWILQKKNELVETRVFMAARRSSVIVIKMGIVVDIETASKNL